VQPLAQLGTVEGADLARADVKVVGDPVGYVDAERGGGLPARFELPGGTGRLIGRNGQANGGNAAKRGQDGPDRTQRPRVAGALRRHVVARPDRDEDSWA
jgi:hypothetical protein